MGLNIKNLAVELLAAEVASLAGETKTEAIRKALLERRQRLRFRGAKREDEARLRDFLEREVWTRIPEARRRAPSQAEQNAILGYGDDGV